MLCKQERFGTDALAKARWKQAVLTASGGMPPPPSVAIGQAVDCLLARRTDVASRDGTTTATAEGSRKKESKEQQLCRAVDKKLHAFWAVYAPALDRCLYRAGLRAARESHKGTTLGADVAPEVSTPSAGAAAIGPGTASVAQGSALLLHC